MKKLYTKNQRIRIRKMIFQIIKHNIESIDMTRKIQNKTIKLKKWKSWMKDHKPTFLISKEDSKTILY